jgi:HAD superfamily hydrolase (TIGR01509 family)
LTKAVVFDCDGVLVDSEKAVFAGIVAVFARRGIHGLVTGPTSSLYGASVDEVISELERETGEPVEFDEVAQELDSEIRAAIARGVRAMDGAVDLLETIRGSRPLAVASNGSRETVEATMKAASIPQVFDVIVTLEAPLRPKPAPDLYLRACELLRVLPERAIAVEDSVPGARSARAAGLMVVGVGPAPGLRAVVEALVPNLGDSRFLDLLELETLQV